MLVKRYIQTNNVSKIIIYTKTMLVKRYIQTNNVSKMLYTNKQCW